MYYFNNILGHNSLINQLKKAINNDSLFHSYLFIGEKGVGRKTIVNTLSQYILCDNRVQNNLSEPCGTCKSCTTFVSKNNPDIIYVGEELGSNSQPKFNKNGKPIKKAKAKAKKDEKPKRKIISAGMIRDEVMDTLHFTPYNTVKKIYIIQDGDNLTKEAQNALLKTLEEPPEYAMFFIIAEKRESLLQTVLSRVIEISVPSVSENLVKQYIKDYKEKLPENSPELLVDDDFISAYARGSIGQGIAIMKDENFLKLREDLLGDLVLMHSTHLGKVLLLAKKWDSIYKYEPMFFYILEIWFRDLFVASETNDDKYLIQKDKKEELFNIINAKPNSNFAEMYTIILDTKKKTLLNVNFRLALETMLISIKEK